VKTTTVKAPSTVVVIYNAILSPILMLMDKMSGRDVAGDRKAKKAA